MSPGTVLITRPPPLAERTAVAVTALGFTPFIWPLLAVEALPFTPATPSFTGAVFTSATPFRLGLDFALPADVPLYVVGEQTALAAREAGFANIQHCAPDVAGLATWLNRQPSASRQSLVHYCGVYQAQDMEALLDPTRFSLTAMPIYNTRKQALSALARQLLLAESVQWIMLYSRRTAQALAAELVNMAETGWAAKTGLLCLSSAVKEPVYGWAWREILVAATPDETALLACLRGRAKPGGERDQDEC